jgi:hypothetical protein
MAVRRLRLACERALNIPPHVQTSRFGRNDLLKENLMIETHLHDNILEIVMNNPPGKRAWREGSRWP